MQRSPAPAQVPDAKGQYALRLTRVKEGQSLTFRMLSGFYGGILTHWWRGRSQYCPGSGECPQPIHRLQPQWRGYCAAEMWHLASGMWYPCALELSEHAELDLRGRYQRGQVWAFTRAADQDGKPQPIIARLLGEAGDMRLPDPFDFKSVVCNVYHVPAMKFDAANPLPPRVLAVPSIGKPPPGIGADGLDADLCSAEEVHTMLEAWKRKQGKAGGA